MLDLNRERKKSMTQFLDFSFFSLSLRRMDDIMHFSTHDQHLGKNFNWTTSINVSKTCWRIDFVDTLSEKVNGERHLVLSNSFKNFIFRQNTQIERMKSVQRYRACIAAELMWWKCREKRKEKRDELIEAFSVHMEIEQYLTCGSEWMALEKQNE